MAGAFGVCLLAGCLVRRTATLWWRGLGLAGVCLSLVPLAASQSSSAGLLGAGPSHPDVLAVDSALLVGGLVLIAVAAALRRQQRLEGHG